MGIGRPESRDPEVVRDYVLGEVSHYEKAVIEKETIPNVIGLLRYLLESNVENSSSFSRQNRDERNI